MEKSRLCMMCCCAFTHEASTDFSSALITKSHFNKFSAALECELVERKLEDEDREEMILSGDLNLDYRRVSVCSECLHKISDANIVRMEMSEVEDRVTSLQRQLLAELKELEVFVDQFYEKMRGLRSEEHTSDEPCLRTYIDEHLSFERSQDVFRFRQRILDALVDLPNFRQQLDEKTHCKNITKDSKEARLDTEVPCQDFEMDVDKYKQDPFGDPTDIISMLFSTRTSLNKQLHQDSVGMSISMSECDPQKISDFKYSIVSRVLKNLQKRTPTVDNGDSDVDNRTEDSNGRDNLCSTFDPRTKYPVEYDAETHKLTVNGIEIIVKELDKSLKCYKCDFSLDDENKKRFGSNRALEAILQDHIIGTHIGGYKCNICNKKFPVFRYLREHHQLSHGPRWSCDICRKAFKRRKRMLEHQSQSHHTSGIRADQVTVKKTTKTMINIAAKQRANIPSKLRTDIPSKHRAEASNTKCEPNELKQKIITRILKKLKRRTSTLANNSNNGGDDLSEDKMIPHCTSGTNEEDSSNSDPRTNYPVEYDGETHKLTVNGIEMIVQEICLKCYMCDFSVTEEDKHRFGKGRTLDAIMQDHIIGEHIAYIFANHYISHGYKCHICNHKLTQYRYLRRHLLTHERGKAVQNVPSKRRSVKAKIKDPFKAQLAKLKIPRQFPCPNCGKVFGNTFAVRRHLEAMHTERERTMCPKCGKMLLPGASLRYHDQACTYRDPKSFDNHSNMNTDTNLNCDSSQVLVENERMGTSSRPKRPMRSSIKRAITEKLPKIKSKAKNFQCAICGKAFRTSPELRLHESRMHEVRERITCPTCGKLVLPGASMRYHNLVCSKRDTDEVYECLECQKKYQNKFLLRRHQRVYHSAKSSERPFICSQCGKTFKRKKDFEVHQAVHSDARPFVCGGTGCSASFKTRKNCRRHETTCKLFNTTTTAN